MATHLLALDQGTSSSRSIVFDEAGRMVAIAQRELRQIYPQPGWVEHDPIEIREAQQATAREALKTAGLGARDIAAIGITNQRETTVLWDRASGRPLHNAIVWHDRRTEPTCVELRSRGLESVVRAKTGLVIDPYFSGTKLKWLLDHVHGAREAARAGSLAFGTIDSWLLWNLTGGTLHATDVTNASRTMLFNIQTGAWDDELLGALDIPRELMPAVMPSSHVYADAGPEFLGAGIPIAGIAGDQQSALFGQGCFAAGPAKNTYGTGCFMLTHTGGGFQPSQHGLLTTAAAQLPGKPAYAFEGSVFIGGAVVQWLRDTLHAIESSGEVQALAESVPDSGGVMFVPAFAGLGAPYWKPNARGAIVGLTRGTTMAHIARAGLESIAYQSAALLDAMNRDVMAGGGKPINELRVDGGACVNDLLMQFQADLLGIPVVRPQVTETTALGAVYLAGLATGVYRSLDTLSGLWRAERTFHPAMDRARAAALMTQWVHAVRQTIAE